MSGFGKNKIQHYSGDITDAVPNGKITLDRMIFAIKHPPQKLKKLIFNIRHSNKPKRDKLKTKLPAFTPCAQVSNRRCYDDITEWTGALILDYDSLPSVTYSKQFRDSLFQEYKSVFSTWLSSSNKGVRAIIRIPQVKSVDEFKDYFRGVKEEFGQYKGFDSAPKNCILPLFYSIDKGLNQRDDPDIWTTKKEKPATPPNPEPVYVTDTKGKKAWVIRNAKKAINKITGNGHPQLRAASFVLGGYVGGSYIDELEAISLMDKLIEGNSYLSQKPKTYKRTSRQMIRKGQQKPLYFKS